MITGCTKLTARELRQAMSKLLAAWKQRKQVKAMQKQSEDVTPHGKMTVKELAAKEKGMQSIEVNDSNIGSFNRIARKYGIATMLNVANNVYYYSHEETETGVNFEDALVEAFNMFFDVEARRIGGAGNADVECLYHMENDAVKKFDLEAKSTRTKLLQINSRRLRTHRSLINSKYTMIVTPNYAIGVLRDISGEQSVIIKAATLANYLYQYILKNGREISYSVLDDVVENGMGGDITDSVNAYVYDNFGHGAEDLTVKSKKPYATTTSSLMVAEEPAHYGK